MCRFTLLFSLLAITALNCRALPQSGLKTDKEALEGDTPNAVVVRAKRQSPNDPSLPVQEDKVSDKTEAPIEDEADDQSVTTIETDSELSVTEIPETTGTIDNAGTVETPITESAEFGETTKIPSTETDPTTVNTDEMLPTKQPETNKENSILTEVPSTESADLEETTKIPNIESGPTTVNTDEMLPTKQPETIQENSVVNELPSTESSDMDDSKVLVATTTQMPEEIGNDSTVVDLNSTLNDDTTDRVPNLENNGNKVDETVENIDSEQLLSESKGSENSPMKIEDENISPDDETPSKEEQEVLPILGSCKPKATSSTVNKTITRRPNQPPIKFAPIATSIVDPSFFTYGKPKLYPLLIHVCQDGRDKGETCDFGTNEDVTLCSWKNLDVTSLKWRASRGENAFWIGGPVDDVTYGDGLGGYIVFETSERADETRIPAPSFESAMLVSPLRKPTEASGICVKFWYAIGGLSADRVRVLLHPMPNVDLDSMKDQNNPNNVNNNVDNSINTNDDNTNTNNEESCKSPNTEDNSILALMGDYDGSDDVVLWEARDGTVGDWKEGQIVYTYNQPHAIIVEGIPKSANDINRPFRGYVAIDELNFADSGECGAFCTFESGTCGWSQDEQNDDFDWKLSRGSLNPSTGPPRDRSSFSNGGMMGGFAYIDTSFPRVPGDRARLMTDEFLATDPDSPLCMRFWTHMYGTGIGSLRVLIIKTGEREGETIWEISGQAGNLWYQGQVPIASNAPFKISFEGEVGPNNLGDIALDDISIIQGPCPSAPQVAGNKQGDCTFEVDECGWTNPTTRDRVDTVDFVRTVASESRAPLADHTIGTPQGFYMTIPRATVQHQGDWAWLQSPKIEGSEETMCVSFWYVMYEPFSNTNAPSLGSLTLLLLTEDAEKADTIIRPLWQVKNHQGPNWLYAQAKVKSDTDYHVIFEGSWANTRGNGFMGIDDITIYSGECTTKPEKAAINVGDCDFQRNACDWKNITTDPQFRWTSATLARRPISLEDHTFGNPVGYAYFDVFNQNANPQTLRYISPVLTVVNDPVCVTFWFAPFGSGMGSSLNVVTLRAEGDDELGEEIWKFTSEANSASRTAWQFGQVQIQASGNYRLSFVGTASNGGFALDDVRFFTKSCKVRPKEADPNYVPETPNTTG